MIYFLLKSGFTPLLHFFVCAENKLYYDIIYNIIKTIWEHDKAQP